MIEPIREVADFVTSKLTDVRHEVDLLANEIAVSCAVQFTVQNSSCSDAVPHAARYMQW